MKKNVVLLFFTWFLIQGCLAGCSRQDYSCFMKVGSYEVTKEEYALLAYDNIATTAREYAVKDGADVNAVGFWKKKTGDMAPIDRVKELTDKEVIHKKGIQILAKEAGVLDDLSYEAFLRQYKEENKKREAQKEAGEVIYGPVVLSEQQFYSYRQSQLEQALEEYTENQTITVSEDELQKYYVTVKRAEERKNFKAELSAVLWDLNQVENVELIDALIPQLGITEELKEALEKQKIPVFIEHFSIDTEELGKENLTFERIVEALKETEKGGMLEHVELGSQLVGNIRVEEKEYTSFGGYEENRNYVEALYREEKAEEYINTRIEEMEIKKGDKYNLLSYEDIRRKG